MSEKTGSSNTELTQEQLIEITKDNLNRILSFFSRVDTLSSVVLALILGMYAIAASNAPSIQKIHIVQVVFIALFIFTSGFSLYQLYKCSFPRLECEEESLIYFQEIAKLTQTEYARKLLNQTSKDYLHDLIKQTWRNAEILKQKFEHIKQSFIYLGISIIPWLILLYFFIAENEDSLLSK